MGGLGKTTLAKKLYNDSKVKQQFDCCSWLFISQQFSIKNVMVRITMDVAASEDKSRLEEMEEEELVKELHKVLEQKRYLVVLDDIWTNEAWNCLKPAFPNGKKGSKVLFTTRNRNVALLADPRSSPVEPPLLTNDDGWKLLSRKALVEDGCAPEYEKLGREMVEKCRGLPLAIAVLGGLLATKKSLMEWQVVRGNINAQFIKLQQHHQYGGVYGILGLSYHDLPFHLKPCFLYLSQFPEDWEFHKRTLIRMWIAEGFVSQPLKGEADQTMEDVGEEYLEELVSRCMVQVSQRDHTGIGVKTCRIHDLVRDMCISKARDENFLGIIKYWEGAETSNSFPIQRSAHRIAIQPQIYKYELFMPLFKIDNPQLRSLFYFVERLKYHMPGQKYLFIFKTYRLLRVLNIDNLHLCNGYMPREIGNLIHLRYLGLRGVGLFNTATYFCCFGSTSLPATIGNLWSLYTLDLRKNGDIRLPSTLRKLECLRHLLVDGSAGWNFQLETLKHLETLRWIEAKNVIRKGVVLKLTNLRNLGIKFKRKEEVEAVLKSPIFGLGCLHSLKMKISLESSFPNLEPLTGCHHLTKVLLEGVIPEYQHSLHHNLEYLPARLAKLILQFSELKQDPMTFLEKLPNLGFLSLGCNSYQGSKMVCSSQGFPQLDVLILESLNELEEWQIQEGAMPCLKSLSLVKLDKLKMIPEGLKFVTTLQELKLQWMKKEFETRVQDIDGVEGDDFAKVQHIHEVSILHPKNFLRKFL